jgi:hypothetical protein
MQRLLSPALSVLKRAAKAGLLSFAIAAALLAWL